MAKSNVVARLTVIRKNGWRTIVVVRDDASLTNFYRFYRQFEAKRSTKELIRTAGRHEGMQLIGGRDQKPGLELILERLEGYQSESNPIVRSTLRIIKKRAYRKLISARPDELGMVKTSPARLPIERWRQRGIPVQLKVTERVAR